MVDLRDMASSFWMYSIATSKGSIPSKVGVAKVISDFALLIVNTPWSIDTTLPRDMVEGLLKDPLAAKAHLALKAPSR